MIDPLALALPLFVGLMLVEMAAARLTARDWYETRDTVASLIMGAGAVIVSALGAAAVYLVVLKGAAAISPVTIPVNPMTIALCLILSDFVYYWSHRLSHERRWLWASHVVHHSSHHFNLSTALRSPWTDIVSGSFLFWAPLALMGFPAELVLISRSAVVVWQFWFHTEAIKRLGWLEYILVTPSHHRVHHAVNGPYLDRNYGGVLIIWDRLFGTFTPEDPDLAPRFGIVTPLAAFNPFIIAFHEWRSLAGDLSRARSLMGVWRVVSGRPGQPPDPK